MKVLFFTAFFYPHKGGVEQYVFELARRLYQRRIEVSVVTCNTEGSTKTEIKEGIKIYRLDSWNLLNGQYPVPKVSIKNLSLLRELSTDGYNIVNSHTRFYISTLLGYLFARYCKASYIHTEHGTTHTVFSNPILSFIGRVYDHTLGRLICSRADKIFAVSGAAGRFARHLGSKGFHIIYNSVDTTFFRRIESPTRSKWGIPPEGYVLTFVGRLIYAKGIQDLIEVFKVLEKHYNLNLLIVGDGDYRASLESLAIGLPNIIFTGEKGQEDIREILSATDILVNPSYSEGLPTSVLEAGACECCVIASDAGGTTEIITSGLDGIVYPAGDQEALKKAIEFLLQSEDELRRYGILLRKKIEEKFDWDVASNNFIKTIMR